MSTKRLELSVLCLVFGLTWLPTPAVAQSCDWAIGFDLDGVAGPVEALAVFDDGSGPALYAGGNFRQAGGVTASHIAKWNGRQWSPLGSGIDDEVMTLTVFDDGTGPALYAGGTFTTAGGVFARNIAKWNGTQWSQIGSGIDGRTDGPVHALTVFDDGSGPALYAAGNFTLAGHVDANYVAKWNGLEWSALGSGLNAQAWSVTVFDDGSGPALYVGGFFTLAGGEETRGIAKWNGTQWSALSSGISSGVVSALTVFDDGTGPALYAGGGFTTAGGVTVNNIAKWNGTEWSALGSGMSGGGVGALTVFDDGSGPALYATGSFLQAGGVSANRIAKWDGTQWSALGSGLGGTFPFLRALAVFDDGTGAALYAGGYLTTAGGVTVNSIAKWDGARWARLGIGNGMSGGGVSALTVFDDGSGPALYAGGFFTTAGGVSASRIALWNGTQWSPLGNGIDNFVGVLTVFDDASGPALYAGGVFNTAGGVTVNNIAKWNGSQWSPLGGGISIECDPYYCEGPIVSALTVFDDGSGPALYAGGVFSTAGGVAVSNIAKWNGRQWSALGGMNSSVRALTVFDDGSGPALYAGGGFTTAGGVSASHVAKWNGTQWSPLGSGMNDSVAALTVFNDGSGPALYAGGVFTTAGSVAANRIAKWDGTQWSPLGSGVNGGPFPGVWALTVFDDGTGLALYAGGLFSTAGEVAANQIAKWNGTRWSPLGSGINGGVSALTVFNDGTGPVLYAGGGFTTAGGRASSSIAAWRCP